MTQNNRPGQSTRRMAAKRRKATLAVGIGLLVLMIAIALLLQSHFVAGIGGATLGLLVLMRIIADLAEGATRRGFKAERRALRGARGEEAVGEILSTLGGDFFAIHDIESPYGNIDHIVITRGGAVCMLETKAHGGQASVENGTLLLNGKPPEKDFVRQALRNATWLSERLTGLVGAKTWVTPIIVFSNAFVPRLQPVRGVRIINKRFLASELSSVARHSPAGSKPWEMRGLIAGSLRQPS